jgi:ATP-dependent protease ClpP protease subunit
MAKRWVASEEDDESTCEPCDGVDGRVYRNRADAYADYPGGVGYKDCVGAQYGNACRGKVQKRRGGERTDSGMTDTRLLNNFRALLTERAAFTALQKPIVRDLKPGQDWFSIKNISAEEASISIFDEIGFFGTSAQGFVDQLNAITTPKITVYVNSPGGEVFDGIAIHTALAQSKAHVTTFNTGIAASAASYIMMAGDTIKTARNAMWMLHDASGLVWGNATACRAQAELLDKLSLNIADMYAMQAGGTKAEWFSKIENTETWYTGEEALAAGLADEMTDADEDEPDDKKKETAKRLSIAVFNSAGRPRADFHPDQPRDPDGKWAHGMPDFISVVKFDLGGHNGRIAVGADDRVDFTLGGGKLPELDRGYDFGQIGSALRQGVGHHTILNKDRKKILTVDFGDKDDQSTSATFDFLDQGVQVTLTPAEVSELDNQMARAESARRFTLPSGPVDTFIDGNLLAVRTQVKGEDSAVTMRFDPKSWKRLESAQNVISIGFDENGEFGRSDVDVNEVTVNTNAGQMIVSRDDEGVGGPDGKNGAFNLTVRSAERNDWFLTYVQGKSGNPWDTAVSDLDEIATSIGILDRHHRRFLTAIAAKSDLMLATLQARLLSTPRKGAAL